MKIKKQKKIKLKLTWLSYQATFLYDQKNRDKILKCLENGKSF